jgi:hypothetical protein
MLYRLSHLFATKFTVLSFGLGFYQSVDIGSIMHYGRGGTGNGEIRRGSFASVKRFLRSVSQLLGIHEQGRVCR